MTASRYEFCEVFVKNAEQSELADMLGGVFGQKPERGNLDLEGIAIDVLPNGRADGTAGDDFVLWPLQIEIEAEPEVPGSRVVDVVSRILIAAWDSDRPAVAACDYEDELPWAGGIQRLD